MPMSDVTPDEGSWEIASAYLDNEVTPDERAEVESDPGLLLLVEQLRSVAARAAAPLPPSPLDLVGQVLARPDHLAAVSNLGAARKRRHNRPTTTSILGVAAAVAIVAGVVSMMTGGQSSDTSSSASDTEITVIQADRNTGGAATAVAEDAAETLAASGQAASASTTAAAAAMTIASAPAARATSTDELRTLAATLRVVDLVSPCPTPSKAPLYRGPLQWDSAPGELFTSADLSVIVVLHRRDCTTAVLVGG